MSKPSASMAVDEGEYSSEEQEYSDTSSLGGIDTSNVINKRTRGVEIDWKAILEAEKKKKVLGKKGAANDEDVQDPDDDDDSIDDETYDPNANSSEDLDPHSDNSGPMAEYSGSESEMVS